MTIVGVDVWSVSVDVLCEVTDCLNRSGWEVNGKQPTHCLDHARVEEGHVVHADAVNVAHIKGGSNSSAFLGSGTHLNDNNAGGRGGDDIAVKRARQRLQPRPLPPEDLSVPLANALKSGDGVQ